jgi:hypothetical protein
VANNSRFLILPGCHHKNLASQILSRCKRRIQQDWLDRFGYPLLLLETFVDPDRYHGTIYRASNWILVGTTKGCHYIIDWNYDEDRSQIRTGFGPENVT